MGQNNEEDDTTDAVLSVAWNEWINIIVTALIIRLHGGKCMNDVQ